MIFLNFVDMDKSRLYGYCGCLRFVFSFLREHTDWAFWWNLTPELEAKLHGLDAWHVQEYENLRRQFQGESCAMFWQHSGNGRILSYGGWWSRLCNRCCLVWNQQSDGIMRRCAGNIWLRVGGYTMIQWILCGRFRGVMHIMAIQGYRNGECRNYGVPA